MKTANRYVLCLFFVAASGLLGCGADPASPTDPSSDVSARSSALDLSLQTLLTPANPPDMTAGPVRVAVAQDRIAVAWAFPAVDVFAHSAFGWTPQRIALDGGAASAVAMDQDTLIVGLPGQGQVRVFTEVAGVWSAGPTLVDPAPPPMSEAFGSEISVKGDTIVVGAPSLDDNVGQVFLFGRSGGVWGATPIATLPSVPEDNECFLTPADQHFGQAVKLTDHAVNGSVVGQTLFVGKPGQGQNCAAHPDLRPGRVYVYDHDSGVWPTSPTASIASPNPIPFGEFGRYLDASEDVVVITQGMNAYGFHRSGAAWVTSGWTAAAADGSFDGARLAAANGTNVDVYDRDPGTADGFVFAGSLPTVPGPATGPLSVSIDGSWLAAGGPNGLQQVSVFGVGPQVIFNPRPLDLRFRLLQPGCLTCPPEGLFPDADLVLSAERLFARPSSGLGFDVEALFTAAAKRSLLAGGARWISQAETAETALPHFVAVDARGTTLVGALTFSGGAFHARSEMAAARSITRTAPPPRTGFGLAYSTDPRVRGLYVVGGVGAGQRPLNDVWRFDPVTGVATKVGRESVTLGRVEAAALDAGRHTLYAIGQRGPFEGAHLIAIDLARGSRRDLGWRLPGGRLFDAYRLAVTPTGGLIIAASSTRVQRWVVALADVRPDGRVEPRAAVGKGALIGELGATTAGISLDLDDGDRSGPKGVRYADLISLDRVAHELEACDGHRD